MDDAAISALLKGARLPFGEAARHRTEELAAQAVSSRLRRRWIAIGSMVAAVLLASTPPVQSLAGDVAELAGIGDPPSDHLAPGHNDKEGTQRVVAVGQTPSGEPVELAVSRAPGDLPESQALLCRFVSFPSASIRPISASCQTPQNLTAGEPVQAGATIGPPELGSEQDLIVDVRSVPPAQHVRVTYTIDGEEHEANVISGSFTTKEIIGRSDTPGGEVPVTVSAAFLPSTLLGEPDPYEGLPSPLNAEEKAEAVAEHERAQAGLRTIVLSATDENGEEIYRSRLSDLPVPLADSLAMQR